MMTATTLRYSIALDPKPSSLRPWLVLEESSDIPGLWIVLGHCESLSDARQLVQSFELAGEHIARILQEGGAQHDS